jgi:hypothetical protein
MSEEKLELRYIPLAQAKLWDDNPKRHDIEALMRSIEKHGFGDPPKYDSQLDGLVYGNGRTEALERLRANGSDPPRGIAKLEDGEWALPVIFGVDAASRAAAVAFAVDHNNLTLLGGDDVDFSKLLAMWDEEGLQRVIDEISGELDGFLVSFDDMELDLEEFLKGTSGEPTPVEAPEEFPSVDDNLATDYQCPKCGYEWSGPPK